jgi:hypothetical protein
VKRLVGLRGIGSLIRLRKVEIGGGVLFSDVGEAGWW